MHILNYTRTQTCPLNSFPHVLYTYVQYAHLYCGYVTKNVDKCAIILNEVFLVKIMNSNVMSTLRGFHWYLVAFEASK